MFIVTRFYFNKLGEFKEISGQLVTVNIDR